MSRAPSLTVALAASPRECSPWDLRALADHLSERDETVEVLDVESLETAGPFDVVHAFGIESAATASGTAAVLVATPDVTWFDAEPGPRIAENLASRLDAVLVTSRHEQEVIHHLGVPWYRIEVIPPAVDAEVFQRIGPAARRTRRLRAVVDGTGEPAAVEAALTVATLLENLELVIVVDTRMGSAGVAAGSRWRGRLEAMRLRARAMVVSPDDDEQRAWWLRSAHVALSLRQAPASPAFLTQAMACGTPAVVSGPGADHDLVVPEVNGFIVAPGDAMSAARAVLDLLSDDFRVDAHAAAASDRALSVCSWPRVAHQVLSAYRRALQRSARTSEDDTEAVDLDGADSIDVGEIDDARLLTESRVPSDDASVTHR